VEWVQLTTARRITYTVVATLLLLVGLTIAYFNIQSGSTGMLDMGIMGGCFAGGGGIVYTVIIGKEQRKIKHE
jgi:hypothetical protein